jgi:hypothetical protein
LINILSTQSLIFAPWSIDALTDDHYWALIA